MFDLRDYQSEALAAVEAAWAEGVNRPVVVLPTGAGKTVCFSGLIADEIERLRKEGKRVLVLAHREELLEQAEAKIKAMCPGIWTTVLKGARGKNQHQFAEVIVASVQTLARPARRAAVDRIGLVIVDECHRYAAPSYRDVLKHYGCMDPENGTRTVGFTATLTRMDGGLPDVWQSVAYQKKIHWMIKNQYLVPPVAKTIEIPGLNLARTRVTAGDLNTKDVADALEDSHAFTAIAESWCELAADRPTIVFMPNVATAERMAEAFERIAHQRAEVITGATASSDRKAAYERFGSGATRILVSCMVLTEGFDAPHTSCVIIGRPTLNPGLYIQMVGRGLRLAEGKDDCLVLDIAGASLKHTLAGVNDLESDCNGRCDCNCLSCGCGDHCKCGIRQCGCRCIGQHEAPSTLCRCAGDESCGCGCPGDMDGTGLDGCVCALNEQGCECRGTGEVPEANEVGADVLKNLVDVDILGTELAASPYTWLRTNAGISFLAIGSDSNLFLLPEAPGASRYFVGRVDGGGPRARVQRLDNGAMDAVSARQAAERHADTSGFSFNSRKSSWRRTAASEAQIRMLRTMKVDVPDNLKKGAASDLLAIGKASAVLDRRFGKYVNATAS